MQKRKTIKPVTIYALIAASFGALVVLEMLSPQGIYVSCAYTVPILLTAFLRDKTNTIIASTVSVSILLIAVVYFNKQDDFNLVTANYSFTLLGIVIMLFFVLWIKSFRTEVNEANSQIASLFNNANEGMILSNQSGEIVLVNPKAEKMFGYSSSEILGGKIDILVPDDIKHIHRKHRADFHEEPRNRQMGANRDLFAKRKDGSVFPVEISLSHYRTERDSFVIAFIVDITTRKKNEEMMVAQSMELQQKSEEIFLLNTSLEKRIEDRTKMLREALEELGKSKDKLAKSLEREKELNDLKSRFVSMASHEFRTPLSAILSSASLIGRYTQSEEQDRRNKHIERIKNSVNHLNDMLGDLLSLGKIEEGLEKVIPVHIEVKQFFEEAKNESSGLLKSTQYVALQIEGENTFVSDKKMLRHIVLNLLSNAIKFSPEVSAIHLNILNTDRWLTIKVKDNGIGIPEEEQKHLFERFFRARNVSNIQGTGLGLHIVSKYVELLGGNVSFSSKINEGTEFKVEIPHLEQ